MTRGLLKSIFSCYTNGYFTDKINEYLSSLACSYFTVNRLKFHLSGIGFTVWFFVYKFFP